MCLSLGKILLQKSQVLVGGATLLLASCSWLGSSGLSEGGLSGIKLAELSCEISGKGGCGRRSRSIEILDNAGVGVLGLSRTSVFIYVTQ